MRLADGGREWPRRAFWLGLCATAMAVLVIRFALGNDGGAETQMPEPFADAVALDAAVNAFAAFTTDRIASRDAAPDHGYTAAGIRTLARALELLVSQEASAPGRYANLGSDLRTQADLLQRDPQATDHAAIARSAFVTAAASIAEIQRARYPSLVQATAALTQAAGAIQPDKPLLTQVTAIERFFESAGDALRAMLALGA